ncbi:hypothetical protein PIB30_063066, partial [Stylosanthes scabra]|nr:hypothetical protein [Stylosanthes scabra]
SYRTSFQQLRTVQDMLQTMERMVEDPFAMSTLEWPSSPCQAKASKKGTEEEEGHHERSNKRRTSTRCDSTCQE